MPSFIIRTPFYHFLESRLTHPFDRSGRTVVNILNISSLTRKQTFPKERIPMNKLDLIQNLITTNGLSKSEAAKIVNLFFDQIAATLEKGDRVEIRGLCCFYAK
jgi:hypothetical protein